MKHNYRAFKDAVMESGLTSKEPMLNCMEWKWNGKWDVWDQFTPEQKRLAVAINKFAEFKMLAWEEDHSGAKLPYSVAKKIWSEAIHKYVGIDIAEPEACENWDCLDKPDIGKDYDDCEREKSESMTYDNFMVLVSATSDSDDIDSYIHMCVSNYSDCFKNPDSAPNLLRKIYTVFTSENPMIELKNLSKLSYTAFAQKYNIPFRTVQNWKLGLREMPEYIAEMLCYLILFEDE